MPNPVQIQVTANTAQAAQAMASFTASTAAGLNNIAVAANGARAATAGLNSQTAALLRSAIANNNIFFAYGSGRVESGVRTLTTSTRAAAQGLNALGRAATLVGFQFMPQLTSSALIGASAVKALADAAKAAGIGLASVSAVLANLALAGFIAFKAKETGDALLLAANATKTQAEANDVLTASLHRLAEARRAGGEFSEEDYQALMLKIQQARGLATELEASQALRAIAAQFKGTGFDAWQQNSRASFDTIGLTSEYSALGESPQRAAQIQLQAVRDQLSILDEIGSRAMQELESGRMAQEAYQEMWQRDYQTRITLKQKELDLSRELIEANFRLTDAEKYDQLSALGQAQGPNPRSFSEQMGSNLTELQNQFGTFSQASASFVTNGIGNAIQAVSDGIMGLIDGTRTWAQTWAGVLKSMAAQGIQFIVQQTTMFIAHKAKELAVHLFTEQGRTAATLAGSQTRGMQEKKEGLTAGFNLAAKAAQSLAQIPYIGWALAVAAFAGIMATVLAASVVGGFEKGGYTGDGAPSQVAGVVHRQEWVMPASTVRAWGADNMAAIQRGPVRTKSASGGGGAPDVSVANYFLADFQKIVEHALTQGPATKIIVQTIDGRKLDLGFNT